MANIFKRAVKNVKALYNTARSNAERRASTQDFKKIRRAQKFDDAPNVPGSPQFAARAEARAAKHRTRKRTRRILRRAKR